MKLVKWPITMLSLRTCTLAQDYSSIPSTRHRDISDQSLPVTTKDCFRVTSSCRIIGSIEESSKLLFSSEGVLDFSLLQYLVNVMAVRDIPANLSYDTFVEKCISRIFQNHAHSFESLHPCNLCFFRFDLLSNGSNLQSLPSRKCGERLPSCSEH